MVDTFHKKCSIFNTCIFNYMQLLVFYIVEIIYHYLPLLKKIFAFSIDYMYYKVLVTNHSNIASAKIYISK